VPDVAFDPVQPPDAVHEVTLLEVHVSVDWPPAATPGGEALSVTWGDVDATVTVAAAEPVPPAPVQLSEYCVVAVSAGVVNVPLVARAPVQPPEAVHPVALVDDHVRVEVWPL
jgi:hypothetical protein